MLYDILIIFVCMFASFGIVELAIYFFDYVCSLKLPGEYYVCADNFSEDDAEYVLRFLEGIISREGAGKAIKGIKLGENARAEKELLEQLRLEFGNIIEDDKKENNSAKEESTV